jgi:hypothetical protein
MFEDGGAAAIERAVLEAHPGAAMQAYPFGENNDTELVDYLALRVDAPVPHWLVVSRGFTELGEKLEEDPALSGWGFELTCRLPADASDDDFRWVAGAMMNVSRYLADKITFLEAYNHILVAEPTLQSALTAVVVIDDPELPRTESENGQFSFFQMVGLTADESEAVNEWNAAALLDLMRARDPLLLTDPSRSSLLLETAFAAEVNAGRDRDGSSIGVHYGVPLLWRVDGDVIEIHVATEAVPLFHAAVRGRLVHGNSMFLFGDRRRSVRPDGSIAIHSQVNVALHAEDGRSAVERHDGTPMAVIRMNDRAIDQLRTLLSAAPGTYVLPALPRVRFVVATSERFRDPTYP